MLTYTKFQERHNNLPVRSINYVHYWSHVCTATIDGVHANFFCQSVQTHCREKKFEKLTQ